MNTQTLNYLHDILCGPKDAVSVEFFGWIEPQTVPLLTATICAAVAVQVRLKPPWFSGNVT